MAKIVQLTYNPFQENTFLVIDPNRSVAIIDPGCYMPEEKKALSDYLSSHQLKPEHLLLTHGHLDHVFGLKYCVSQFNLEIANHKEDLQTLNLFAKTVELYGIPNADLPPEPSRHFEEGDKINFGETELEVLFVPGHSPGHVAFVDHSSKSIINGDCLFMHSIGRTDLPGGNHEQLLHSIRTKLFTLPDDYTVYCGHGPSTTIGNEKQNNPFF